MDDPPIKDEQPKFESEDLWYFTKRQHDLSDDESSAGEEDQLFPLEEEVHVELENAWGGDASRFFLEEDNTDDEELPEEFVDSIIHQYESFDIWPLIQLLTSKTIEKKSLPLDDTAKVSPACLLSKGEFSRNIHNKLFRKFAMPKKQRTAALEFLQDSFDIETSESGDIDYTIFRSFRVAKKKDIKLCNDKNKKEIIDMLKDKSVQYETYHQEYCDIRDLADSLNYAHFDYREYKEMRLKTTNEYLKTAKKLKIVKRQ